MVENFKYSTSYNAAESIKDYIGFQDSDFSETSISVNYENPDLLGDDYAV